MYLKIHNFLNYILFFILNLNLETKRNKTQLERKIIFLKKRISSFFIIKFSINSFYYLKTSVHYITITSFKFCLE